MTDRSWSVILTTPASRCLVLLLESAPEVVNQGISLLSLGEDGMVVSANTAIQNISIIRRVAGCATGETDDTLVAGTQKRVPD